MLVFSLSWTLHSAAQKASYRVKTVVIDAGHGGKDSGASSGGVKEKDIALKIALKLGAYITEGLPDVKVIYTRKDDRFIELHRRAAIANEAHADLFISIHCNANRSSNPYGTETYVMGLHKSKANLEVAKKENASILLEDNYENEYQGYDPNLPENTIIFSLFQNAYLNQSLSIASMVEEQFRKRVNRHDRGVKQAGFLVLYRTTMPGILIETGFLTNPSERKFLNSDKGQVYIASAIYRAFKSYKKQQEEENNRVMDCSEEANTSPAKPQEPEPKKESPQPNPISFSVQFLTSKLDNKEFKDLTKVKVYTHGGLFKYVSGEFSTFEEAWQYKKQVVKLGYKDAFVVAFKNNKRIDIKKARALTEP
ncbi:MAG: cell wall hydrolase [Bacteroidetes bacterium]|nr:MAG: cell wall hydrolase [Bacteroidota bacterium]PIE88627.1 MAG: cell wall hydrolase [Bacteroidota bacterium]